MFDTNIFNRVLDYRVPIEILTERFDVYVTHVQQDELNRTTCRTRRNELTRVFSGLAPQTMPTESAVWNVSKWNQARWTKDDNLCTPIKAALDKREQKENNIQDALIAETAIKNEYTLVTDDGPLREVATEFGAKCMTWRELQQRCRTGSMQ